MNLVFDMDDTLYDLMEPFERTHDELFKDKTDMDCTELFMKSRIYSDNILEKEKKGLIPSEEAFYQRMKMTYKDAEIDISKTEGDLFEARYRFHQKEIEVFDFMVDILDYCKQEEIPIAALSNGSSRGQRKKVAFLGLERWFEADKIFISGEIDYQKPDVHAFEVLEDRLGIKAENTWYIGDTYEMDVTGASQAGWHTIWFNHRQRRCPQSTNMADKEIQTGKELLPFIKYINGR